MYRILILISAFLIAISGMLFLQGGELRDPAELAAGAPGVPLAEVTSLSAPATMPAPPAGSAASALAAAVAAASGTPAPQPAPPSEDPGMASLTAGVLADLGVRPAPAPAGNAEMATMTANVLAGLGLGGAAAQPGAAPAAAAPGDLQGLVVQALREGQSDAYIDLLLNEAAAAGRVAVPAALITAEGKVDTNTLLASIVRQAQVETDAYTNALVAEANGGAARVAPVARPATVATATGQFYVVEPGDSLAFIALQFYGTPAQYTRIFEANRDKISSPDMIRVGQKLLIPG